MGKPKQAKSDKKGKGSTASKDQSPSQKTKQNEAKTPESGADTPTSEGESGTEASPAWPPALNRPMMSPLVLPSDYTRDELRRPSMIYIWSWDNIWFFPMGLLAILIIVLGMVCLWYVLPARDTRLGPSNATSLAANDTANATEDAALATLVGSLPRNPARIPVGRATDATDDELTTLHAALLVPPYDDAGGDWSTELEPEAAPASSTRTHGTPQKRARSSTASPKSTPAGTEASEQPRYSRQSKRESPASSRKSSSTEFAESAADSGAESSASPVLLLGTSRRTHSSSVEPDAEFVTPSSTERSSTVESSTRAPSSASAKSSGGVPAS
ncbi:sialidase-like [Dermacentor silvarum]|uniref:sialidase-like n=1 Tax=Dermacentor silvarum TaxID=543639 RepID=UPI00210085AE|nr:sialidase-like [Dermacentor silvarum]